MGAHKLNMYLKVTFGDIEEDKPVGYGVYNGGIGNLFLWNTINFIQWKISNILKGLSTIQMKTFQ